MKRILLLILPLVFVLQGCVTTAERYWESDAVRDSDFNALISPSDCLGGLWGCSSFILTIKNKTDKDLEINWNKTMFIKDGQTSGGFMFEGVLYSDRNNTKSPDIVFPGSTLQKEIFPSILVYYSSGRYGGWRHDVIPSGRSTGVYLTVNIDGKEVNKRITGSILKETVKKVSSGN
jgi:hypothetical protein